ncbi:hypothetical protein ACFLZ5_11850, partial [Thermodesulfobacteriota bacterium]
NISNSCNLIINRNEIAGNQRAGIHTGTDVWDDYFSDSNSYCTASGVPYPCCTGNQTGTCWDGGGFIGETDSAILDVSQNKVHNNGLSGLGGGMNIRHASGSIYNNLVYGNTGGGGIIYGYYVDEIINNTVADNGGFMFGGGIIFDDLGGSVDYPTWGDPLFAIPIVNNIVAYNGATGILVGDPDSPDSCDFDTYRDYNLLYWNNYPMVWKKPQLGSCSPNANEIFADQIQYWIDPDFVLFEDRDNEDYSLAAGSPAEDSACYTINPDPPYNCLDDETPIDMGAYGGPNFIDW